MAEKKKPQAPDGALVTMAKNIGAAAGKVAEALGMAAHEKPVKKAAKLAKKNKSHVPRRQKKAAKKAAMAPTSAAKRPPAK
jgi:hypothetical protein